MIVTEIARVKKKVRACAYVRVSTKEDQQEDSFANQKNYWENKLKNDPNIEFVGIFSDEGISGRKVEARTGYMDMMRLVKQGEIDKIYVKSMSRFGRNKLEALRAIQEVRNLNVEIYFEKENLTTSDPKCSFSLTLMATLAEQESESQSKNMKWSIQKKLDRGEFTFKKSYGYDVVDGKLVIVEEEAKWVRYIFQSYVYEKKPAVDIADELNNKGILTPAGSKFDGGCIKRFLKNPIYMGDSIRIRTVEKNGKRVENKGDQKQYYFKDTHPAIIDRDLFFEAQNIHNYKRQDKSRAGLFETGGGPLRKKLRCKECGSLFKPTIDGLWFCSGYDKGCKLIILQETAVIAMVKRCLELYNDSFGDIEGLEKCEEELKRLKVKNDYIDKEFHLGKIDEINYEQLKEEINENYARTNEMRLRLIRRKGQLFQIDKMTNLEILAELKVGIVSELKTIEMTLNNGFIAKIKYPKLERSNYTWKL